MKKEKVFMKRKSCLLASVGALCLAASLSLTCQAGQKTQSYAHPSLFGTQAQVMTKDNTAYVTAGKVKRCPCVAPVIGKEHVFIKSWASNMLAMMERGYKGEFNPKLPILRSELAILMAEGLAIDSATVKYNYTDIANDYWAKEWIDKALAADVMIGYPDRTFRPDQPVTKAEVFATIAKVIDVPFDRNGVFAKYNDQVIQQVPTWAVPATKEVVESNLLRNIPNTKKLINDEFLSREQVAYLVGTLRYTYLTSAANGQSIGSFSYRPTAISIKLSERISARTSNVGDIFTAETTKDVTIQGVTFPAGSTVKGIVDEVNRPGVKNPAYIKVRFVEISNDDTIMDLARDLAAVQVDVAKNPNIVSRVLAAPFSAAGRVAGVAGRTAGSGLDVAGDGLENLGDNLSDAFADTFSLHPLKGLKSVGSGFITIGKGVYDLSKLVVSGTFGVLYELGDEVKYIILPSSTNDSSLNPDEELTIIY